MIVLQWEEQGLSRVHLGILSRRQFDASEHSLRGSPVAASLAWLIDDFRGSWVDLERSAWLEQMAACLAVAAAAHAHRRHAVVVVSEVSQRLMRYLRRVDIAQAWPGCAVTRLFDCPLQARRWVEQR